MLSTHQFHHLTSSHPLRLLLKSEASSYRPFSVPKLVNNSPLGTVAPVASSLQTDLVSGPTPPYFYPSTALSRHASPPLPLHYPRALVSPHAQYWPRDHTRSALLGDGARDWVPR